jgi:uncharacterized damage-inducible protein DinB
VSRFYNTSGLLCATLLGRLITIFAKEIKMSRYMEEKWPWIEGTHALRNELLDAVTDADLNYNPGGKNMTLGALCREMGEVEYAYIQSLKTFTQDWSYRNTTEGLASSVGQLKNWYQTLDDEFKATVAALSDEDFKKTIERGFPMPVELQLDVYIQALLIFLGKGTIFLLAMNKTVPQKIQDWIG